MLPTLRILMGLDPSNPPACADVRQLLLHHHEDLAFDVLDRVHPEACRPFPEDFLAGAQVELEAMPRAHQNLPALVERDIAGTTRVPRTADDTLADGCALLRAAVHDGTKLAAVQTNHADFAPVEFDEFHLADGEVVGAANLETLSFSSHGCLVALQPKCPGSIVEEHGLACAGLQHP